MAVKYKDIKDKLETDPLTPQELEWIQQAEDFIDDEIRSKFGKVYYEVFIDKSIVRFDWSPADKKQIDTMAPRRTVMQKELEKRYSQAGWSLSWGDYDNNYVIFKGKK
jgi:hypothetical protein